MGAHLRLKHASDPALRRMVGLLQAMKLALVEMRQTALGTGFVESDEEAHAVGQALLAHTRDPQRGFDAFRTRERGHMRHVQTVLDRVAELDQAL